MAHSFSPQTFLDSHSKSSTPQIRTVTTTDEQRMELRPVFSILTLTHTIHHTPTHWPSPTSFISVSLSRWDSTSLRKNHRDSSLYWDNNTDVRLIWRWDVWKLKSIGVQLTEKFDSFGYGYLYFTELGLACRTVIVSTLVWHFEDERTHSM